jgi:hypothetical protein
VDSSGDDAGRSGPATLKCWPALGLWKVAVIAAGAMRRAMDEPKNKALLARRPCNESTQWSVRPAKWRMMLGSELAGDTDGH